MKYRASTLVTMARMGFIGLALLAAIFLVARRASTQDDQPATQAAQPASAGQVTAIGTAFNYSGLLNDGAANGPYDFQFKLFGAASGGTQVGSTLTREDVPVKGGLFNTSLDFGIGIVSVDQRYLEVGVRPGSQTGAYTLLSPRRPIMPTPLAMFSNYTRGIVVRDSGAVLVNESVSARHPSGVGGAQISIGFGEDSARLRIGGPAATMGTFGQVFELQGYGDETFMRSASGGTRFFGSLALYPRSEENAAVSFSFTENGTLLRLGGTGPLISGLDIQRQGTRLARFDPSGLTVDQALTIRGGADLAERFEVSDEEDVEPGTVMIIDPDNPGHLTASTAAYDTKVAGVVSGAGDVATGLVLSQAGVLEGDTVVAIAGRVYVRAEAISGPIAPGDLLTTSAMPGHAMRAADADRRAGAVLGKAMSGLDSGTGLVLVLVNLQ